MKKIIFAFLLIGLVGCGYKPSSYYTTPILGKSINTQVDIDVVNPTNSIFLKDALNEAVYAVFNAKVSKNADSAIKLSINSSGLNVLDYDTEGYPILYRANASITAYVTDVNGSKSSYKGSGSYDFSINSNSVLSDNLKHNAMKEAYIRALQEIEFKIAQKGIENDNQRGK
jgi:hypothetical protein